MVTTYVFNAVVAGPNKTVPVVENSEKCVPHTNLFEARLKTTVPPPPGPGSSSLEQLQITYGKIITVVPPINTF